MCPWVSRALVLVSSIKDSADLKIRLGVLGDNVVFLKVREGSAKWPLMPDLSCCHPGAARVINL